jgi:DNA-directed RNA polymerase specialized sigma subunit
MKTYNYKFITHEETTIEIEDKWAEILEEIDTKEKKVNRRETRFTLSLNYGEEIGVQFADTKCDILDDLIKQEDKQNFTSKIQEAVSKLQTQQQEIVKKIFNENKTLIEVAEEMGVSYQAIQDRLRKIYARLLNEKLF